MGTLSEIFRYLEVQPKKLQETKLWFSHVTPNANLKELRSELKLYKTYCEEEDVLII